MSAIKVSHFPLLSSSFLDKFSEAFNLDGFAFGLFAEGANHELFDAILDADCSYELAFDMLAVGGWSDKFAAGLLDGSCSFIFDPVDFNRDFFGNLDELPLFYEKFSSLEFETFARVCLEYIDAKQPVQDSSDSFDNFFITKLIHYKCVDGFSDEFSEFLVARLTSNYELSDPLEGEEFKSLKDAFDLERTKKHDFVVPSEIFDLELFTELYISDHSNGFEQTVILANEATSFG